MTILPTYRQSLNISVLASDPLFFSSRNYSEDLHISTYEHESKLIGGYWTARMILNDVKSRLEQWIEAGLARHIEVYNPALNIIWEGFVNQITVNLGPVEWTVGPLLDIGNRVRVAYSSIDTSVNPPVLGVRLTTDPASNTPSQQRYGIIDKIVSLSGATDTQATQARDVFLADNAFPQVTRRSNLSGNAQPQATLECLGYWHWLKAYIYANSATGTQDLTTKLEAILGDDPNGIFSTSYTKIASNATTDRAQENNDKLAETVMKRVIGLGDSSLNAYSAGFYAGQQFVYQSLPTQLTYQQPITTLDGIQSFAGNEVRPWDVEPANWLYFPDVLIGGTTPDNITALRRDARSGLIESVRFTAPYGLSVNEEEVATFDILAQQLGVGG